MSTDRLPTSNGTRLATPTRPARPRIQSDGDLTKAIGDALGEHNPEARRKIKRVLDVMGRPKVAQILREVQQIERDGGLMVKDGSRRRTKGGVFFYTAKRRATKSERRRIWPCQEAFDGPMNGNTHDASPRDSEAD